MSSYPPLNNCLAINPGKLRHLIQIGTKALSQDSYGEPLTTWPVYYSCHSRIEQLSGRQLYQGAEFTSSRQVKITIRWPGPGVVINVGDRIFFGAHVYDVQICDNVMLRNRVVILTCLEIDGAS